MKRLIIMIGIAGWLLNESALARDAEWFERRMGELDKVLLLGDEKEKIQALGEFVSIGTMGMDEQQKVIFNKAQSALLAIPCHAKFFQNKIETMRAQFLVDIKKSDEEIYQMRLDKTMVNYGDYEHYRQFAFEVLALLPSSESVAVLGHFLNDPEERDGKDLLGNRHIASDWVPFPINCGAAYIAISNLGIANPPTDGDLPERNGRFYEIRKVDAWKNWWNEVKDGKRTYRFIGSDIEYGPDGPISKDKIPQTGPKNDAHAPGEQAGADQPATSPADKVPAKIQPSTPTPKDAPPVAGGRPLAFGRYNIRLI
jgi:hypothetical protein